MCSVCRWQCFNKQCKRGVIWRKFQIYWLKSLSIFFSSSGLFPFHSILLLLNLLLFSKLCYMLKHANHLWIAHDRNAMEGNTKQTQNKRKKKQQTEREKNLAAKIEAKIVVFCNRTQCGVLCAYEFIELDVYVVILSVAKETERNSLSQALIQHRTCFNITNQLKQTNQSSISSRRKHNGISIPAQTLRKSNYFNTWSYELKLISALKVTQ